MSRTANWLEDSLRRANPISESAFPAQSPEAQALLREIVSSEDSAATERRARIVPFGYFHRRGAWFLCSVGVVVVLVAAFVSLSGRQPRPTTTASASPVLTNFQPAAAVTTAGGKAVGGTHPRQWQLVADISALGWQETDTGPAGFVTCASASVCYVSGIGTRATIGILGLGYRNLYVSWDGGASWSSIAMPARMSFTSHGLSCVSADLCAAGVLYKGQPALATTSDGGHQWSIVDLPAGKDVRELSCFSLTNCDGVLVRAAVLLNPNPTGTPAEDFVETSNGGESWTTTALPKHDYVNAASCTSATNCVLIGEVDQPFNNGQTIPSFVLVTDDGGSNWADGVLPATFTPPGGIYGSVPFDISCADSSHCVAFGSRLTTPGCAPDQCAYAPAIIASTDGGLTWHQQKLPSFAGEARTYMYQVVYNLVSVSCATATNCWIAGAAFPNGEARPVVIGTDDGGTTWTLTHLSWGVAPGRSPFEEAFWVSCPSSGFCLAVGANPGDDGELGSAAQASQVPIYRYEG